MRIFYVGQLGEGGTCLDRLRALRRLGHEVVGFNVKDYEPSSRVARSLRYRTKLGCLLSNVNRSAITMLKAQGAVDCVWVDKGIWIFPETVLRFREMCAGPVVHFTPDPQLFFHRSRHFLRSIRFYDHVITTKKFEIDGYKEAGAKNIILTQQSFCPVRYGSSIQLSGRDIEVGFVGHYERHYHKMISAAISVATCNVWGQGWRKSVRHQQYLRDSVIGDGVWGVDYVRTLASMKIGLGLLSKYIPEQHTTRTFEIPAAGAMLLAERTPQHLEFFKEGVEAEFFDGVDELKDKIDFYLKNEGIRIRIARRGRERCVRSGYDTDSVLNEVLDKII